MTSDTENKTLPRSIAIVHTAPESKDADKLARSLTTANESDFGFAGLFGGLANVELISQDASNLLEQLRDLDADLIMLADASWHINRRSLNELTLGYELGARVTSVTRDTSTNPPVGWVRTSQNFWLFLFFKGKGMDVGSPIRLYDKEAFMNILDVFTHYHHVVDEDSVVRQVLTLPCLMTAVESSLGFRSANVVAGRWNTRGSGRMDSLKNTIFGSGSSSSTKMPNIAKLSSLGSRTSNSSTTSSNPGSNGNYKTKTTFKDLKLGDFARTANRLKSAIRAHRKEKV